MDDDYSLQELTFLAQTDPSAFERRRARLINRFLERFPRQKQLGIALQSIIDTRRERADSAEATMAMIVEMMSEQVRILGQAWQTLNSASDK